MWTVGLTVEIKLRFQISPAYVDEDPGCEADSLKDWIALSITRCWTMQLVSVIQNDESSCKKMF